MGLQPSPGFTWNPVKKYPRNNPCICGSGKKFKKCCIDRIPPTIPTRETLEKSVMQKRIKEKLK